MTDTGLIVKSRQLRQTIYKTVGLVGHLWYTVVIPTKGCSRKNQQQDHGCPRTSDLSGEQGQRLACLA